MTVETGSDFTDFHSRTKSVNKAIIPLPPARNGGHPQGGGFREIVLLNKGRKERQRRSRRARAKRAREKSLKAFRYSPTKKNTPDGGFRHGGHGRARDTRKEIFFFFGKDARKTKRPRRFADKGFSSRLFPCIPCQNASVSLDTFIKTL